MTSVAEPTTPVEAAAAAKAATRHGRRHVDELDMVRVLTFACVIGVHTVSHANPSTSQAAGGALILLHFTREAFFWLTGFVLTFQYGRRRLAVGRFWRRRFLLVGVPYVVWSLLYCGLSEIDSNGRSPSFPAGVLRDVLYGTAWYHLYFLLVSLQVYLLFPLIVALVRRTERHHVLLLVVAGVVQAALLTGTRWFAPYGGWATFVDQHENALFWNYGFWILAGAVAAWHLDAIRAWVAARARLLALSALLAAVLTIGYYAEELARGQRVPTTITVLQPVMMLCASGAIVALFLAGRRYAAVPEGSRLRSVVHYASDRSFAIFLVHPALIWLVLRSGWVAVDLPNPFRTMLVYGVVLAGSVAVSEVLRRSPLSMTLTGRPMIRRVIHAPAG